MAQHTPGPWAVHRAKQADNTGGYDCAIIDLEGKIIAEAFEHVGWKDARSFIKRPVVANARLLATAPELLDCLSCLLAVTGGYIEGRGDDNDALLERCRTAIAKAKGGAA